MTKIDENTQSPEAQSILNQIVLDYRKEQKSKKRWKWFQRIFFLMFFVAITSSMISESIEVKHQIQSPHVGVINVIGTIMEGDAVTADNFAKSISDAYKSQGLKALMIRINSPGGSPVQADYIFNTLKYFKDKYPKVKIYAVCSDICASAAYFIAAAADEIYANESSMVGSIGVLYNGFGFVGTMEKMGVTRRLYTAGRYKGLLDPFSPTQKEEELKLHSMLDSVHEQFINKVKQGRQERLLIDDETFSGLFWTGIEAKKRGLIDGFGSPGQIARDIIKIENMIDYTYRESMMEKFAKSMGTAMVDRLPKSMGLEPGFR